MTTGIVKRWWYKEDGDCTAPEAEALAFVLSAILGRSQICCRDDQNTEAKCHVLSYLADFELLWGLEDEKRRSILDELAFGESPVNLLLIADGIPRSPNESEVAVGQFVTAYDWVVALSCRIKSLGSRPPIRIFIFDTSRSSDVSAFGARMLPQHLGLLPWIRVYRSAEVFDEHEGLVVELVRNTGGPATYIASRLGPDALSIDALIADLTSGRDPVGMPTLSAHESRFTNSVVALRDLWINNLTKAEDRHAVSNIVAPLILADGLAQKHWPGAASLNERLSPSLTRQALKVLLGALGLLTLTDRSSKSYADSYSNPTFGALGPTNQILAVCRDQNFFPDGNGDPFRRFEDVRILLVDDQCESGYREILSCLLFGEQPDDPSGRVRLEAMNSANWLLNTMFETAGLSLPSIGGGENLVEDDFFRKILAFYDSTGACKHFGNSDPALATAVRAARAFISRGRRTHIDEDSMPESEKTCPTCGGGRFHEDSDFDWELPHVLGSSSEEALNILFIDLRLFGDSNVSASDIGPGVRHNLLLPLLLSHLDPSLPVIVFSSSQQRAVAEAFKQHSSVITCFSKPLISGYADCCTPTEHIDQLITALDRATVLHEMRVVWLGITTCDWGREPTFEVQSRKRTAERWHVYNWNGPSEEFPGEKLDAGDFSPRIGGIALRKRLKSDFCRYILSDRFFDYLSVPWELLEGALVPDQYADDLTTDSPSFSLSDRVDLSGDNRVVRVLQHIRNKKVHGQSVRESTVQTPSELAMTRHVVIVMQLLLIGFIKSNGTPQAHSVRGFWDWLHNAIKWLLVYKYPHLRTLDPSRFPGPQQLIHDSRIAWSDFALFATVSHCWTHDSRPDPHSLQPCIREAINRLVRRVVPANLVQGKIFRAGLAETHDRKQTFSIGGCIGDVPKVGDSVAFRGEKGKALDVVITRRRPVR